MEQHKLAKFHKWYSIILAVLVCLAAVGLLISTLLIYFTGEAPHYSREIVGRYLLYLSPLLLLVCCGVIASVVLHHVLPYTPHFSLRGRVDVKVSAKRLQARMDASLTTQEGKDGLAREEKRRKVICLVTIGLWVILLVPIVLWLIDRSHFTMPYKNSDVVAFFLLAIPLLLVGLAAIYVAGRLLDGSWARVRDILKAQAKTPGIMNGGNTEEKKPSAIERYRLVLGVRIALLTMGVAFVVIGIFNGGAKDVYDKAVKLCMECIGLG